jgi:hypothetical protein
MMLQIVTNMNETLIALHLQQMAPQEFKEIQMVKPCGNCENCIRRQIWNVKWNLYKFLQLFNLILVCSLHAYITSNTNTFGKQDTLEGRWSGKCWNFNWIVEALASWNCQLLLYNLVDVTGLSTQFWDISAKNKLQIYNPIMCFKFTLCVTR